MRFGLKVGKGQFVGLFAICGAFVISVAGCSVAAKVDCTEVTLAPQSDQFEAPLGTEAVEASWQQGKHADSFVEADIGGNQACARCHARASWRPAMTNWPAGWSQPEAGYEPGPARIPEGQWLHIDCQVCHPTAGVDEYQRVGWLDIPHQGEYRQLANDSQLCHFCHVEEDLVNHNPVKVAGVHDEFSCLDCHDPHQGAASCTQSGCHLSFDNACTPVIEHNKPHKGVTCQACHAVGDYDIKWDEDREQWNLHQMSAGLAAGRAGFVSVHYLSTKVACERCHTPGDLPWME